MLHSNGVTEHRVGRLTFDGGGRAFSAVDHKWDGTNQPFATTGSEYADMVFKDVAYGIRAGVANNDAEVAVLRCHFIRCSERGVVTQSYNAADWWIRHCVFDDCQVGVSDDPGAGSFFVYESVFHRSTKADVTIGNPEFFSIRNNYSIGSKAFFTADSFTMNPCFLTLQGNTVVDPADTACVRLANMGPLLLLDNVIASKPDVTNGPIVSVMENLFSLGNQFTASNPLASYGRALVMDDGWTDRAAVDLEEPEIPGPLPNRHRPTFEVPAGAVAAEIQRAIDQADQLRGQRPVVHLPAGEYAIDRSLVIPAGCDVQLVGDGLFWDATTLNWKGSGIGPVLRLAGPTRATLRHFTIKGAWQATGIVVENCDQPGARVNFEQFSQGYGNQTGLLVDRLDYTDVTLRHSVVNGLQTGMKVIGGPARARGEAVAGRTRLTGGGVNGGTLCYDLVNGPEVLVQDTWYEGANPRFMHCTDSGRFTLNGGMVIPSDPNHGGQGTNEIIPAIEIENFRGQLTFLTTTFAYAPLGIDGASPDTSLLLLGDGGHGSYDLVNFDSQAEVGQLFCFMFQPTADDWWVDKPDRGTVRPDFLRKMLAQERADKPGRLTPLPDGVTDARFERVWVELAVEGLVLARSNSAPTTASVLPPTLNEKETLSLTIPADDVDLPFNQLSYDLVGSVPAGASINPTNAQFSWTPAEDQGPGTYAISVRVTDTGWPRLSVTNTFTVTVNEVNHAPSFEPPAPGDYLMARDVGSVSDPLVPGATVVEADGSLNVTAGGTGFHYSDNLHFTYQQVTGDFDVRVQVESLEARDIGSSAGLMARENLDSGSRMCSVYVMPTGPTLDGMYENAPGMNAYAGRCRETQDADNVVWAGMPGVPYPNAWVRLRREGETFIAFAGTNGVDWVEIGRRAVTPPFPPELLLGLATFSYNNNPGQTTRAHYLHYGPFPTLAPSAIVDRTVGVGQTVTFSSHGLRWGSSLPNPHVQPGSGRPFRRHHQSHHGLVHLDSRSSAGAEHQPDYGAGDR